MINDCILLVNLNLDYKKINDDNYAYKTIVTMLTPNSANTKFTECSGNQ